MFKIFNIIVSLLFGLLASEIISMHVSCNLPGIPSLASPVGFCPSAIRFSGDWRYPIKQAWDVRLADSMGQTRLGRNHEILNDLSRCCRSHSYGVINSNINHTNILSWMPIAPAKRTFFCVPCHLFEFKNKQGNKKKCFRPKVILRLGLNI